MSTSFKVGTVVVLLCGAAAAYYYGPWRKASDKNAVQYETATVDRGPVIAKVTASGTLSALVTVQIGSQVSGRIKELNVDFNSPVKKRQVIARIDPELFNAAREQARANYAAAQGDLAKAKAQAADAERQLARTKNLADRKLVAQADLDTAQANSEQGVASVMAATGRLAQAHASLHQAEVNLTYTNISSPIDGVVISRSVDVGQTVAASLQAPTLFVLAEDLRKMQVDTSVAEADIGKLRAGMDTSFTVDAYPQQRFTGKVRQIRNAATNVQNVITYDAVIDVDNPDLLLKPGMTANVTFVHAERDDVLRVPNAALRFKPTAQMLGKKPGEAIIDADTTKSGASAGATGGGSGGGSGGGAGGTNGATRARNVHGLPLPANKRAVWVLHGTQPSRVELTLGVTDGTRSEIVDGALKEGDRVITDTPGSDKPSQAPGMQQMRRVL